MRCEHIKELLSPYLDQVTDERENQLIEAHLDGCENCRQELKQLQQMHALLCNLDAPQIPESFADDLHWRLLKERRRLIVPTDPKRPRRQGWIAAAVAGLALAAGILASSFLPVGNIAHLWQDDTNKQDNHAKVAVEDIIQRFQAWRGSDEEQPGQVAEAPGTEEQVPQKNEQPVVEPPDPANSNNDVEEPPLEVAQVEPKIADVVKYRIKVDSLAGSVDRVMEIADASGAESKVAPGTTVTSMNGSTREVSIKVPRSQVEQVLAQLSSVGSASAPMTEQVELTEQYSEAVMTVEAINEEIKKLEALGREEDQARIESLKQQSQYWSNKKTQIERDASVVTLKVFLVEEEAQH